MFRPSHNICSTSTYHIPQGALSVRTFWFKPQSPKHEGNCNLPVRFISPRPALAFTPPPNLGKGAAPRPMTASPNPRKNPSDASPFDRGNCFPAAPRALSLTRRPRMGSKPYRRSNHTGTAARKRGFHLNCEATLARYAGQTRLHRPTGLHMDHSFTRSLHRSHNQISTRRSCYTVARYRM